MSAPLIERLRDHAGDMRLLADIGDMGRKPDPTCLKRIAATDLDKAADTITSLLTALKRVRDEAIIDIGLSDEITALIARTEGGAV